MSFFLWLGIFVLLIVIGYFLDREIYFYEGVRLGPRVQAWLYDRWAKKYDEGKRESQLRDDEMLARPLLDLLKEMREPFVLDFATGTGRLSYALLSQPDFKGHIIALDLSQGMLEQAAVKLMGLDTRETVTRSTRSIVVGASVELLRHQSLPLPFPDAAFDVVCCLEVLELFSNMDEPLAELTRVLRPGGILLTSRGTEESGRKAKVKSKPIFRSLLEKYAMTNVQITTWWKLFDRVLAQKDGISTPVGTQTLSAVLKCGECKQIKWKQEAGALKCQNCGKVLTITSTGIVLN
jgi:ubiquinone/menaquinone biosynthesis C-methylase UbiE